MAGAPGTLTAPVALELARWAAELDPSEEDLALARRSLLDTAAVMVAGRDDPRAPLFDALGEAGRWAALAHVLDYDDLHMPSTTHISAVCVPAAVSCFGGDARAYLAGAGAMARLGTLLGWRHYAAGWHATCTAGAPAAAVAAATARGLDAERVAVAIALAIPAAGGVQRAFGTAGKSLQVGFAADAGVRAAALAEAGASADVRAVEDWLALVGGEAVLAGRAGVLAGEAGRGGAAVPGGLAVKLYPCCYALQRPIAAAVALGPLPVDAVQRIRVITPACSLAPLIHHRPTTGLEGKFSLEYAIAAALLDGPPGLESFTDSAVRRPEAVRLGELVEVVEIGAGDHLLAGKLELEVRLSGGAESRAVVELPPGAPERAATDEELRCKLELCAEGESRAVGALTWGSAAAYLRSTLR